MLGVCAITGSTGYVGSVLANELRKHMPLVALVRKPASEEDIQWSFESAIDLPKALRDRNVTTLIHAAWDMKASTLSELNRVCVNGSARLFEAAQQAGVERIVFISTISAFAGCRSAYGLSKLSVENLLKGQRAVVLRPGLVFGNGSGGVFGSIQKQVQKARFLPMIGQGTTPQFLLHETTLSSTALCAAQGDYDARQAAPITLAHPRPWPFRDLVRSIARAEGKNPTLVPAPWPLLLYGMRFGEALGLPLPFKSDSVVSFVYADKAPDFTPMQSLGIQPIPYMPGTSA